MLHARQNVNINDTKKQRSFTQQFNHNYLQYNKMHKITIAVTKY
jgi:hypothetical protein